MDAKELFTPEEVAEKLKVHKHSVYRWVEKGCPTEIRRHKMMRLDFDKVVEWLQRQKKPE